MDEVLESVEHGADARNPPRDQGRPRSQPGDQLCPSPRLLHCPALVRPAMEVLSENQVGGQVGGRPPLTQRGCIGAEVDQEITELATLSGVDRFSHLPTITRLVDSSTILAEPEVDPRRESGRGRGRHLSGDHQLVGLALHLVARFRLAGEIGAGGARAPAGPPFSTRRPPSHSRRSLREGSGARRSALKEAGPTYPDARHQSLSHPATVQHHDHPTGTAGCDSPARKPPWLIASRRPNGKSAPAGPRITGCGRSSQPCTWAGRDSLKGCVIRVNNSGRPLSAPSE